MFKVMLNKLTLFANVGPINGHLFLRSKLDEDTGRSILLNCDLKKQKSSIRHYGHINRTLDCSVTNHSFNKWRESFFFSRRCLKMQIVN